MVWLRNLRSLIQELSDLPFQAYVSQLTLGVLLGIFPLLLVMLSLLSFWVEPQFLLDQLGSTLALVVPQSVLETVLGVVRQVLPERTVAFFSVGFLVLLYAVESLVRQAMSILNTIYQVKEKRSLWRRILVAILLILGGGVLVLAVIQLLFLTTELVVAINQFVGRELFSFAFLFWRWPLVILLFFAFIYLSYCLVADLPKRYWRYQWVGAVFVTFGWLVMSLIFNLYVNNFADYNATYGLLGTAILLLFYLKLNANLYVIGAAVNARLISYKTKPSFWARLKSLFVR